jgi:type IV pilus assembly protein PilC
MALDINQYHALLSEEKKQDSKKRSTFAELMSRDIKLTRHRLSDKNKEAFYLELFTMISAGVELREALELIEKEQSSESHKRVIRGIKERLVNGDSFSNALKVSGYFTSYEYYSVQIGEETGMIAPVLEQLAIYYTKKIKQRRQFMNALSYPIVIMITSVGAVAFMLAFIVPMFADIFSRFGGDLPAMTQMIISISGLMKQYFLHALGVFITIFLLFYFNRQTSWYRKYSALLISNAPLVGGIYTGIYLARFCNSMSLLISARVPLVRAIQLVRQMIDFHPLEVSLEIVEKDIMNGISLHRSLSAFRIFKPRMIVLLKVGEEVNRLDVFFKKLADQHSEDVEHKTSLFSAFLEPFMIIFLGIMVGFILIAMYLPMFRLSTSIGG